MENAVQSQMYGKPCFKINEKAFVCFFQIEMVFKLSGTAHSEALALTGSTLFDPSGKGRPMKEWVQVPGVHMEKWTQLAKRAFEYVGAEKYKRTVFTPEPDLYPLPDYFKKQII